MFYMYCLYNNNIRSSMLLKGRKGYVNSTLVNMPRVFGHNCTILLYFKKSNNLCIYSGKAKKWELCWKYYSIPIVCTTQWWCRLKSLNAVENGPELEFGPPLASDSITTAGTSWMNLKTEWYLSTCLDTQGCPNGSITKVRLYRRSQLYLTLHFTINIFKL